MRGKALLLAVTFMTLVLSATVTAEAKFARTDEPVPVDNLLKNLAQYIKDKPDDAAGYYTLGRVHALAYAQDDGQVEVNRDSKDAPLPTFARYTSVVHAARSNEKPLSDASRDHLLKSIENYRRATELNDKSGLYWLGYGWMLQQASLHQVGVPTTQPVTSKIHPLSDLREMAIAAYRKAVNLTLTDDQNSRKMFIGDNYVSLEAAQNSLELLKDMPDTAENKLLAERCRNVISEFNEKRDKMPITPIVFPLDRDRPLNTLIDDANTVSFDLAGFGDGRKWPWVTASTAILVWDPQHTGRISSGRQLFGSVTWWMFWRNGYEPLAMLDDNRDGVLAGSELAGLAVWVDRNTDGISDAGEVRPIGSVGVERLSVRHETRGGVLQSPSGVIFRDGRTVSSYDWTPTSKE